MFIQNPSKSIHASARAPQGDAGPAQDPSGPESPAASQRPKKPGSPGRHLHPVPPPAEPGAPPPATPPEPTAPEPPREPELPPAARPHPEPPPIDPEIALLRVSVKGYEFNAAHPFWALAETRGLFKAITRSRLHEILLGGKRPREMDIAALNACFPEGIAAALEAQAEKKPTASAAAKPRKAGKAPNFPRKRNILRVHTRSCLDASNRGIFFKETYRLSTS